jgi:transketolase
MRKTFLNRVHNMIIHEEDTVFLTVDIGMWMIRDILRDYPDRAMNVGIFEDGMMSIAAGMSMRGLVPTIYGIQPYLVERAFEQIKLDLAYQGTGINIVGTGAAVDYSKYGYSHYCAEDIGILKYLPGIQFIAPGSPQEFSMLFEQTYRNGSPTFFRLSDHPNTNYHYVEFGKAALLQLGAKATVIAVSTMLDAVLEACVGEDVTILYYTTLEPFDKEALYNYCTSGKILICEPEYVGSLTHDVIETFPNESLLIKNIGFPREIFRNYGTYEDKMRFYGLTSANIHNTLKAMY